MKFKNVSLLLALVMILSSFSVTVLAGTAEDEPISVSTSNNFNNATHDTYGILITPDYGFIDNVIGKEVWQFKTEEYYSGQSAGKEPRMYLIKKSPTSLTTLGGLDWKNYDFLKISFDIYIGDNDDGVAFRMRRMKSDGTENVADLYIGVGGENFTTGKTATSALETSTKYGYEFFNNSLETGKYHHVVIELGSNSDAVNFYINNKKADVTMNKKTYVSSSSTTTETITGLPEGTYGFAGSSHNRMALIPKSASTNSKGVNPLDLRLHKFTMTATNTAHANDADGIFADEGKVSIWTNDSNPENVVEQVTASSLVYNYTGNDAKPYIVMVAYKDNGNGVNSLAKTLVVKGNTFADGTITKFSKTMNAPTDDYDFVKLFMWTDSDNLVPIFDSVRTDK